MSHFNICATLINGKVHLRFTQKNTSNNWKRKLNFEELPSLDSWDRGKQYFSEPSELAINVNKAIKEKIELCNYILKTYPDIDSKTLLNIYDAGGVEAYETFNGKLTLAVYLKNYIQELKNLHLQNKKKSANYQNYITLLHTLEKEGNILNTPINEVTDEVYKRFCKWVIEVKRTNINKLCTNFKAVINNAINRGVTHTQLLYKAPRTTTTEKKASINFIDYQKFVALDIDNISLSGPNPKEHKQMYKDVCMLIFEMGVRPVDVITLNINNIIEKNGIKYYKYIPEKQKNRNCYKEIPINKTALSIIDKYTPNNIGFVLPFVCNKYYYDFEKRYEKGNRAIGQINRFLTKAANYLGIEENITTYSFRRGKINKLLSDGTPIAQVAALNSTSVDMVSRHYANVDTQAQIFAERNADLYKYNK